MNKYDKNYDDAIKSHMTSDFRWYSREKSANAEVSEGKRRNRQQSALASNPKYRKFLELITDIVGTGLEEIHVKWSTGGISGGSCWGTSEPQRYISTQSAEELSELDEILKLVCPNISFLVYKDIYGKVVHEEQYSQYEYYGNQTDYTIRFCLLSELFDVLNGKGLLDNLKD